MGFSDFHFLNVSINLEGQQSAYTCDTHIKIKETVRRNQFLGELMYVNFNYDIALLWNQHQNHVGKDRYLYLIDSVMLSLEFYSLLNWYWVNKKIAYMKSSHCWISWRGSCLSGKLIYIREFGLFIAWIFVTFNFIL